ncbi:MAG: DNA-binding protein, partial [Bacteroidetes bacterium QS_1_63_11]
WPEQETANEEIEVAERVKAAVLEQIPEQAHP